MRYLYIALLGSFLIVDQSLICAGTKGLVQPEITVGQNLQVAATITLPQALPAESLEITLTSADPTRVLLSTSANSRGLASIVATVRPGLLESSEFYVQGVGTTGTTTYTATAPGFGSTTAKVTVAPSGIVLTTGGPLSNASRDSFMVTVATVTPKIRIYSALLDSSMHFVANQPVAGGSTVSVDVTSSDPSIGAVMPTQVKIPGGRDITTTEFHPKAPGSTTLAVSVPPGFVAAAQFARLTANILMPGLVISDHTVVGKNLQACDTVISSQPAPQDGLPVTLTSDNSNLLLSASHTDPGSKSITLTMPAGQNRATYCFEAVGDTGVATVSASAPGFRGRTTTVTLAPSGIVMGFTGPPDEAEVFRDDAAEREHGAVMDLSEGSKPLTLYMERLTPVTHRGADITVQSLRFGKSVTVELESSNPAVGTVTSPVVLTGVQALAKFTALSPGKTVISVKTPDGFTSAGNSTSFVVIVNATDATNNK
jgi:hypothetical protein